MFAEPEPVDTTTDWPVDVMQTRLRGEFRSPFTEDSQKESLLSEKKGNR